MAQARDCFEHAFWFLNLAWISSQLEPFLDGQTNADIVACFTGATSFVEDIGGRTERSPTRFTIFDRTSRDSGRLELIAGFRVELVS